MENGKWNEICGEGEKERERNVAKRGGRGGKGEKRRKLILFDEETSIWYLHCWNTHSNILRGWHLMRN